MTNMVVQLEIDMTVQDKIDAQDEWAATEAAKIEAKRIQMDIWSAAMISFMECDANDSVAMTKCEAAVTAAHVACSAITAAPMPSW